MSLTSESFAISKGSTIFITGVNGFIGSHIADQFLRLGFKVRGTTRSLEKNTWISALFKRRYGNGTFELAEVPDMRKQGAFVQAVKGVSAIIHTATIFTLDPDPYNVIPGTLAGVTNALEAAAQEPSVERFVLTSSSLAAVIPKPDTPVTVTAESWTDEAVELAYREPPYEPERALPVYAASKTLAEREAWKFMHEETPAFILNTVLPNMNFGASLDVAKQGRPSTSAIVAALFEGDTKCLGGITPREYRPCTSHNSYILTHMPEYFVDVQDTAILHVAAAIHPGVQSERIFAFAEPVNGDKVLAVLRRLYPRRSFPAEFQAQEDLSCIVPRGRAEALLREVSGHGWTSLQESIRRNTEDLV